MNYQKIDFALTDLDQISLDDPNPTAKTMTLFKYGRQMEQAQFEVYQSLLSEKESIKSALCVLLLGYCYEQSTGDSVSPDLLTSYTDLLEWFIEHHPCSFIIWRATYPSVDENFERLRTAWLRQCHSEQSNVFIWNNGAHFCARAGADDLAEVFWKRAKELDPSAIWAYELACIYKYRIESVTSMVDKQLLAKQALSEIKDMINRPNDYPEKSYLSPTLWQGAIQRFQQLACEFEIESGF
ncbi:MAG TPA: hypothetical protein V6C89_02980 [Drouetiella sp.]|jgi:hypothetical protein